MKHSRGNKPQILFITNKLDFTTDYLIDQLSNYKVNYLRINSEDLNDISVNVDIKGIPTVGMGGRTFELDELKSILFRRAPSLFPPAMIPEDEAFLNRERRHFFEGLYLTFNCLWINPIFATYIAERKIYQLKIAKLLGFNIPNTIISNDANTIIAFSEQNAPCIIKPISSGMQEKGQAIYSMYTSNFDISNIPKNELFEAPILIQEKIKNHNDIRITVIGDHIFSASISKSENEVDWRRPEINKNYAVHNLPTELEKKIFKLNDYLNLNYSAIDFILDPDGNYVFLEINPAGEWAWIEKDLGFPISQKIIEMLTSGHKT